MIAVRSRSRLCSRRPRVPTARSEAGMRWTVWDKSASATHGDYCAKPDSRSNEAGLFGKSKRETGHDRLLSSCSVERDRHCCSERDHDDMARGNSGGTGSIRQDLQPIRGRLFLYTRNGYLPGREPDCGQSTGSFFPFLDRLPGRCHIDLDGHAIHAVDGELRRVGALGDFFGQERLGRGWTDARQRFQFLSFGRRGGELRRRPRRRSCRFRVRVVAEHWCAFIERSAIPDEGLRLCCGTRVRNRPGADVTDPAAPQ